MVKNNKNEEFELYIGAGVHFLVRSNVVQCMGEFLNEHDTGIGSPSFEFVSLLFIFRPKVRRLLPPRYIPSSKRKN